MNPNLMNPPRHFLLTSFLLTALLLAACRPTPSDPPPTSPPTPSTPPSPPLSSSEQALPPAHSAGTPTPSEDPWEARRQSQIQAAQGKKAFHQFTFQEQRDSTGITFRHRIVDDSGKNWKPVHYDHGSGLASADVDGNGHLDLYFLSHLGENQLWCGLGNDVFENRTDQAGIALEEKVSIAAAFGDIDNDGDPDLFVTTANMGNHLYENQGDGTFKDITQQAFVGTPAHSSGCLFWDYNRDGLLDLFVCNIGVYTRPELGRGGFYLGLEDGFQGHLHPDRYEKSFLYKNLGNNQFQEVSSEVGLEDNSWSGDASICDLNQDGYPDLYLLNMQGDDHYYENQQGTHFIDRTAEYFEKTPWGAMGIKFFDDNLDGHLDLFITDMHSDMTDRQTADGKSDVTFTFEKQKSEPWCSIEWTDEFLQGGRNNLFGNAFQRNRGDGTFEEISQKNGTETYWPWGVSVGDFNADAYEDIFVTAGMGHTFRYGANSFLINELGNGFFDAEYLVGIEPRAGGKTHKTGFTLYCSGADKDHPLCQGQTGTVRIQEALSTRSSIALDLDEDGDLDLITNEMNDGPLVLINNLTQVKSIHYLKVQLQGSTSNRDGLGARVTLHVGNRRQVQQMDGNTSYLGQSLVPLYFGLGEAERVDSVEVLWPSGIRQVIPNPPVNGLLKIQESSTAP